MTWRRRDEPRPTGAATSRAEPAGSARPRAGSSRTRPPAGHARTEASEGKTSPEELLATAHASCYSMAVSNELSKAGFVPTRVDVVVEIDADKAERGWTVQRSRIHASRGRPGHRRGDVPADRGAREGRLPDLPRDRRQRGARARRQPRLLGSADARHRARRGRRPRLFIEPHTGSTSASAISDG